MELTHISYSIWSLNNIEQYCPPKERLIPSSFGGQYCPILFRDEMEQQMWANSIFFW
jgi:hypothetical protein